MCNTGNEIVISQLQMQSQIFQSPAKFKNKSDTFWLKLFILKNTLNEPNPLTPCGNKRSHILK